MVMAGKRQEDSNACQPNALHGHLEVKKEQAGAKVAKAATGVSGRDGTHVTAATP
jgi:hypothetical protein